jgi:hypothetical protein
MTDDATPTEPPSAPSSPPATPPPAAPPAPPAPAGGGYPLTLDFDRDVDVQNWRPLVNWLLAIPHWIVVYGLEIAAGVLWIVSFFTVLFTRRNPFVGFQAMVLRYQWRVMAYVLFLRNEYPPFEFQTTNDDRTTDTARLSVEEPGEMNRWLVLVKWLLAIPHYIVLAFVFIGVWFVVLVAFFMVLFTGKWSEGMRNFVVGAIRWSMRVNAYILFLTDEYPPFSLEP